MRVTTLAILLLYPVALLGNPIVVFEHGTYYDAKKVSENCIVQVGREASRVSCEVDYRLRKAKTNPDSYYLHFALPVYLNPSLSLSQKELIERLNPRIELDGEVFYPRNEPARVSRKKERERYDVPEDVDLVFYHFTVDLGLKKKAARLLVSYEQPTINDRFYYLPLFESGKSNEGHRMDIVSISPEQSIMISSHDDDVLAYSDRITVHLKHQKLIEVTIANKASLTTPGAPPPSS